VGVRAPLLFVTAVVIILLGYQPSERRQIEQDAFSGRLLGLVATNALELGVDIGVLDAVIVCGFPVTVASFVGVYPPHTST
jgi:ATP-dependent helicase YprA (DUF1998 family)